MALSIETNCLLPDHILANTNVLCRPDKDFYLYNLECLSMVLEAFLLYDKVFIYDYIAICGVPDLDEKYAGLPIAKELDFHRGSCIEWIDPYGSLSIHDRVTIGLKMMGDWFHTIHGEDTKYSVTGNFYSEMRNSVNLKLIEITRIVKASMDILGVPDGLKEIVPSERNKFIREYFAKQLWRIDQLRTLNKQYKVSGAFLAPFWEPLWQHERIQIRSALHEKFRKSEEAMLATQLASYAMIDVSPLVVVALDRTKKPEQLPETIRVMRNEFGELRSAGSNYAKILDNAETYGEAAEIVREWGQAWESVLRRIYSHSVSYPLIRKLFSWDVIKQFSVRSFFLNSAETVFAEFKNLTITKKLWTVGKFEKQFLKSRIVERRIKELYGSKLVLD